MHIPVIERIEVTPFQIPFATFLRSGQQMHVKKAENVLVRVTADDGTVGIAEANAFAELFGESQASIVHAIRDWIAPRVKGNRVVRLRAALAPARHHAQQQLGEGGGGHGCTRRLGASTRIADVPDARRLSQPRAANLDHRSGDDRRDARGGERGARSRLQVVQDQDRIGSCEGRKSDRRAAQATR